MSLRKIIIFLLCILGSFFIFNSQVSGGANPYPKIQTINDVTTVSCTYFAWQQAYDMLGIELPRWGNAVNWYERARLAGYQVGIVAKSNSIAVWKNSNNIYGHVAYVVSTSDDSMVINEGGITTTKFNDETKKMELMPFNGDGIYYNNKVSLSLKRGESITLLGFIYLTNEEKLSINEKEVKDISTQEIIEPTKEVNESPIKIETTTVKKENNSKLKNKESAEIDENKIVSNEVKEKVITIPKRNIKKVKTKKKHIIVRNVIILIFFLITIIIFFGKIIKNIILKMPYLWYNLN